MKEKKRVYTGGKNSSLSSGLELRSDALLDTFTERMWCISVRCFSCICRFLSIFLSDPLTDRHMHISITGCYDASERSVSQHYVQPGDNSVSMTASLRGFKEYLPARGRFSFLSAARAPDFQKQCFFCFFRGARNGTRIRMDKVPNKGETQQDCTV